LEKYYIVTPYKKYLLYKYVENYIEPKYIENNLGPKFLKENDFEKRKFKNSHPNIIKLPVSIEK
jgi:hypothetical protein